jgi:chromosome segregation protein
LGAAHLAEFEASRAGDVERTRVDYLDKQILDADRRREALAAERAGLDVDALEEAFEQLHLQHDTQKTALDELSEDVELRKQAWRRCRNSSAMARTNWPNCASRPMACAVAWRWKLQQAALGQEQGAAVAWLKARGLDSAASANAWMSMPVGKTRWKARSAS